MALLRPWVLLAVAAVPAVAAEGPSLHGAWLSQGYGYLLEIDGRTLRVSELTATTCVPSATAERVDDAVPGREATFKTPGGHVLFIREGGDPDHKRVHSEGSASDVRIDRVRKRPSVCDRPVDNTPMGNFEVFSRTWAENYISFDLKKTDWDAVVRANRPKVTPTSTPAELFDVLEGMIKPFGDAHTSLNAPDLKRRFRTLRPGTERVIGGDLAEFRSKRMPALLAVTERAYLQGPLRTRCNGQIQYGRAGKTTGYLRILSFSNYREGGDFAAGLADLEAALDAIFTDPALEKLVIDVRINFGGADPYGLVIASRLAAGEYLAYTKEARSHPVDRDRWAPPDESRVAPSSRPGFRGSVVELIGPLTISAGETFTQALMGRSPRVTRIGESTQGVFSDVLGRQLPNGWRFGLPNEVYRTPEGATFDGPGIPPDIPVPVFADEDVAAGRDPAMARALQVLGTE
jgi:hypothetical protein